MDSPYCSLARVLGSSLKDRDMMVAITQQLAAAEVTEALTDVARTPFQV
jgi:hypothetical protein